jgi:hypothetical protein
MTTERTTRWTAWTALATSTLALGLSTWGIGCERDANANSKHESVAEQTASGKAIAKETAVVDEKPTKVATDVARAPSKPPEAKEEGGNPAQPSKEAVGTADVELKVKRLSVTHEIDQREPVLVDTLSLDKEVVAFVELANGGTAEGQVITFEREGKEPVGYVKLGIPGDQPRWRTWGKTRMVKEAGEWEAVVRAADGTELARQKFVVE